MRNGVQLEEKLLHIRRRAVTETTRYLASNSQHLQSKFSNPFRSLFSIDKSFTFLNHGAFGAALIPLSNEAQLWRQHCEQQPLKFYDRDLFPLLADSIRCMSRLLSCNPSDLLPLQNVTTGINALVQSIDLQVGDEVVVLSLTYGSTKKIVRDWCNRSRARMRTVDLPLPVLSEEDVIKRVTNELSSTTRVVILDHITSNTAMVLPIDRLARVCKAAGAVVIVDAAHSLFSQHVQIQETQLPNTSHSSSQAELTPFFQNIDFWLTNCHKWFASPKGAACLWINPHTVHSLRPAVVSHGYAPDYNSNPMATHVSRGKFLSAFAWDGCRDYAAWLTLPSGIACWDLLNAHLDNDNGKNIECAAGIIPLAPAAKWENMRIVRKNLLNDVEGLCRDSWRLQDIDFACPYTMRVSSPMRLIPLPEIAKQVTTNKERNKTDGDAFALQEELHHKYRIEVPVKCLEGRLYVRLSAHCYNQRADFEHLVRVISHMM